MLTCTQSNHGVAFRGARGDQDNGKATCPLFCSAVLKVIYFAAATVYNSTRTSSLCGPLLCECGHCLSCLCCVCYGTCACVQVRAGLCICVLEPHISASFCLLLLLTYHAVCITPSLTLSSSRLCGRHGTTVVT